MPLKPGHVLSCPTSAEEGVTEALKKFKQLDPTPAPTVQFHRITQRWQSDGAEHTEPSEAAEMMQVVTHVARASIRIQRPVTQDTAVYLTPLLTINSVVLCTVIYRSV